MKLYVVYCVEDQYSQPTFHATKESAMKSYLHISRLIGDRHGVKIGEMPVTNLPEDEVFEYAETHYIERTYRTSSADEELKISEI